jgi:putative acetyltransferase
MTDILIRPERPDHPQIAALIEQLDRYLGSLYAPEHNHLLDVQALLGPDVTFLAAWQGDVAVGCAATRHVSGQAETAGRAYGEVKRMFVAPQARGRRLGDRLLKALECHLLARGISLALLETGAAQHEAVRLYQRCGYRQRGPFGGYPDNGLSLFMAKDLAA